MINLGIISAPVPAAQLPLHLQNYDLTGAWAWEWEQNELQKIWIMNLCEMGPRCLVQVGMWSGNVSHTHVSTKLGAKCGMCPV